MCYNDFLMTGYQPYIQNEFKDLFDLAGEVDGCTKSLLEEFNRRNLKLFDLPPHQRIFLFIITRSVKTYASILELCKSGYGQDVSTLLRGLLENLVTARYIINDPATADEKTARFVAYKWVIFKRHLPEQEKGLRQAPQAQRKEFFAKKKMVLAKVDEFKEKFHVTSDRALVTWSGKTIKDMAAAVDPRLLEEYETTFRLCSRFSHPSILGDNEYLIQEGRHLIFSPLPSNVGVAVNLKNAVRYILDFLVVIDGLFGFGKNKALKAIKHGYERVAAMACYQDDALSNNPAPKHSTAIKESRITFKTQM